MIKDEIYAWLDNTGAISKELRAHLDKNLKDFGSMFYPQPAFQRDHPPSELEYQIAKGFIGFFTDKAIEIDKLVQNDLTIAPNNKNHNITKKFMQLFQKVAAVCNIRPFDLAVMTCLYTWYSKPYVFDELLSLPMSLEYDVFGVPLLHIKNIKKSPQYNLWENKVYIDILDSSEECLMLDLLAEYKETIEINNMLIKYDDSFTHLKNGPSDNIVKIHAFLIAAITSTNAIYILDSARVQNMLSSIENNEQLIPIQIKQHWNLATLLYENPVERKNTLRLNTLNTSLITDEDSDITFI